MATERDFTVADLSLDDMRRLIGDYLVHSPYGGQLWDILTALRGPDAPSETKNNMNSPEYRARRDRKYKGVEIIRAKAFFGQIGGGARYHDDDTITLIGDGDHHDRHLRAAAAVLGLKIKEEKK